MTSLTTLGKNGRVYEKTAPIERFLNYVDMPHMGGCWNWTGGCVGVGYGEFSRGGRGSGQVGAHVWSYEWFVGPIPEGLVIDHLCRNRQCVFPGHLEAVTQRENVLRGNAPPAYFHRQTHCKRGHPFVGRNYQGSRTCGKCWDTVRSPL